MTKRYIYLAGPISGCFEAKAVDWRKFICGKLKGSGIVGISPLRCEPPAEDGRFKLSYPDPTFGTARAISSKNLMDVRACDLLLAYFPKRGLLTEPSYGTVIELGWAKWEGKPTILVTDDPYVRDHSVVNVCSGWVLETLDEALTVIHGLFDDYVGEE